MYDTFFSRSCMRLKNFDDGIYSTVTFAAAVVVEPHDIKALVKVWVLEYSYRVQSFSNVSVVAHVSVQICIIIMVSVTLSFERGE